MDDTIRQIGERLKGLREVLDIPAEDMAELCGVSLDTYYNMEEGSGELSISNLQKISKRYGIALDVLLFGEEPHMGSYFLTRKGQGMSVERHAQYRYQSLASGFRGRKAEPFIVLVEPRNDDTPLKKNAHEGQEFNVVAEGCMELTLGKKVLILNEGDSIYFDASQPHCMRALNGKPVKLLAVII
ncbi:helix-turn-helix domain-containing protein [Xylanibacter caecicola]|uniref:helix-turn-helix domain-containing protein n=1 Tax=Xylanibacter caecicola TaxID=2736294 RepID=UPI00258423FA|nr:XRE family transcriptional regulator [Xylanibacter caecicola]